VKTRTSSLFEHLNITNARRLKHTCTSQAIGSGILAHPLPHHANPYTPNTHGWHAEASLQDDLLLYDFAVAAAAGVVVRAVFVSNLSSTLATAVLAALHEACVPVRPHDAVIQPRAVHVAHALLRVLSGVILDEAEAAGGLVVLVEAHHDALHIPRLGEQFVDLLLGGVEGEVAHIQCGGEQQAVLLVDPGALKMLISI